MAIDKKKSQNIITAVVVLLALVLVTVALLVKFDVINFKRNTIEYVTETRVVTVAQTDANGEEVTDENGNVVYYTMVEHYTRPSISSNHKYPTTTKKEETGTTGPEFYYEVTSVEHVTDANGEAVTNENGEWVTKVNKQTQKCDENGNAIVNGTTGTTTTTEPTEPSSQTTSVVYRTLPGGKPIKDIHGNPVTKEVITEAPTEPPTESTKPEVHQVTKATTTKKSTTTTTKATTTKKSTTTKVTTEEVTEPTSEAVVTTDLNAVTVSTAIIDNF